MGMKVSWFCTLKKVQSHESKAKNGQESHKPKKGWFGRQTTTNRDPVSLSIKKPEKLSTSPLPLEESKLTEAENEQSKHAYSVALATAVAAEAAVAAAHAAAEVVRLTRFSGKSKEEVAAIKIQTAFRGFLARQALRAMRGLARLKSLIKGPSVKRQTTTTLKCMQTLTRVQSQIRASRSKTMEENLALQRKLQHKHEKDLMDLKPYIGGDWDDSMQSKEQVEAKLLHRQGAAIRRERALAYAFSHQQMWKNLHGYESFMNPMNPEWGWTWVERWKPWEKIPPSKHRSKPSEEEDSPSSRKLAERRHSSVSCSSNASSPSGTCPGYMSSTESVKAKSRLGFQKRGESYGGSGSGSSKKKLSFSPGIPRRFSGPPRIETYT